MRVLQDAVAGERRLGAEGGKRMAGGWGRRVGGCSGILLCDSHQPQGVAKGQIRR